MRPVMSEEQKRKMQEARRASAEAKRARGEPVRRSKPKDGATATVKAKADRAEQRADTPVPERPGAHLAPQQAVTTGAMPASKEARLAMWDALKAADNAIKEAAAELKETKDEAKEVTKSVLNKTGLHPTVLKLSKILDKLNDNEYSGVLGQLAVYMTDRGKAFQLDMFQAFDPRPDDDKPVADNTRIADESERLLAAKAAQGYREVDAQRNAASEAPKASERPSTGALSLEEAEKRFQANQHLAPQADTGDEDDDIEGHVGSIEYQNQDLGPEETPTDALRRENARSEEHLVQARGRKVGEPSNTEASDIPAALRRPRPTVVPVIDPLN